MSRTRRGLEVTVSVAALVAVLFWMSGAFHAKVGPGETASASASNIDRSAGTVIARAEDVAAMVEVVGTVEALARSQVAAQVAGVVREVRVRPGAAVAAGDVLAVIAAPEVEAQELQADGARAATSAQSLQSARDAERAQKLYEAGAVSRVEMERALTAHALALAAETSTRGMVRLARSVSAYRTVRASQDGIVAARLVEPGDLASPGRPLFTIEDTGVFRFAAAVSEADRASLALGDSVEVLLEGDTIPRIAMVTEVVPAIDPVARTVTVRVTLAADPALRSGAFGRMRYGARPRRVVVVPSAAVVRTGTLEFLRVVPVGGGIAATRYVRLGRQLPGDRVEILAGVEDGEAVVVTAAR